MSEILNLTWPHTVRRITWEPNTDSQNNQTLTATLFEFERIEIKALIGTAWNLQDGYTYCAWLENNDRHVVLCSGRFKLGYTLDEMQKFIAQDIFRSLTHLRLGVIDLCSGQDQPGSQA